MRTIFICLVAILLISACSPASPDNSGDIQQIGAQETSSTNGATGQALSTIIATSLSPAVSLPTATPLPSPSPTPIAYTFDRDGYRQFAVLRNQFPGFNDYRADRSFTEITTSLSPDGSMIAVSACWGSINNVLQCESADSGFLVVLDTSTGDLISEIPLGDGWPGRTAFTADGTGLIYTTQERKVAMWNISTGSPGLTLYEKAGSRATRYPDVAASPDGKTYAAVVETSLFVWDPTGNLLFESPASQARYYASLSYSADGSRLTTFSPDRAGVDIYDTSDWSLVRRIPLDEIENAAISPDGLVLAGINPLQDKVIVWNINSGEQMAEIMPDHRVQTITFNPKGDLLIIIGSNNLENPDDYSIIGSLYETKTWTKFDDLYTISNDGEVLFSRDGRQMAVVGYGFDSIWGMPDAQLMAGFEVVKRFQTALSNGDYSTAASLCEVDERDVEFLAELGMNPDDVSGSLETLCAAQTIFCHPVKELVLMGYDWDDLAFLVRLEGPDGETFTSPKGAQIIFLYLTIGKDGQPRIFYLPMD
ncbi:MAG: WD40 repeat domain-containing protein [Anaerolineaceae bacterium]